MKKSFITLGLMAFAALTLTNCAKQEIVAPEVEEQGVPFEIVAGNNLTKTITTNASKISWKEDDKVNLFVAEHGEGYSGNRTFTVSDVDNNKFTGTLPSALDNEKNYDWKVVYPWKSGFKLVNASGSGNGTYLTFGSQNNENQSQAGYGSKAHLAGSHMPLYGVLKDNPAGTTPSIVLKQAMSVIEVHVTNAANDPLTVTSVSVAAPEGKLISGTFYVDFSGDTPTYTSSGASYTSNSEGLTVTGGTAIPKNGTADFYIAVLPFDLAANDKLTVTVNGAAIPVTVSAAASFAAGKIKTVNVSYTGGVVYNTVAEVLAGGTAGAPYNMQNLLVYAVNGGNVIVGDNSGKMLIYKNGHSLKVGDLINITGATVTVYTQNDNSVLEINGGTFTTVSEGNVIDHGAALDLNVEDNVNTLATEAGTYSAIYVSMTGNKTDNYTIEGEHTKLNLNVKNTSFVGNSVVVTGYVYAYNSIKAYHNFQAITIEQNADVASLDVTPTSLTWGATQSGEEVAQTITVTTNGTVGYTISGTNDAWSVVDDEAGTITVYPKAANTSTTEDKVMTLTITHKVDGTLKETVTCTQGKASAGGSTEVTVVIADYATANAWVNGTQYKTVVIDENVSATVSGGSNTGKYYTNGNEWRTYQSETPTITINAGTNVIEKVAIKYNQKNGGVLLQGTTTINSDAEVEVNATSITFSVGNSGTATNGQVNITQIYVKYN